MAMKKETKVAKHSSQTPHNNKIFVKSRVIFISLCDNLCQGGEHQVWNSRVQTECPAMCFVNTACIGNFLNMHFHWVTAEHCIGARS